MKQRSLQEGLDFLRQNGMLIISILATQSIPADFIERFKEQDIDPENFPRLLLANGGGVSGNPS